MKKVTAVTVFQTAAGMRASIVYSDINDEGLIVKDNERVDRIIVDETALQAVSGLLEYAQALVDGLEG